MLCLLITVSFLALAPLISAQEIEYKEPDSEALEREQRAVDKALNQADQLIKEGALNEIVAQGRAAMQSIQPHSLSKPLQLPLYLEKERDDAFMARVIASGESMDKISASDSQAKQPIVFISFSMPEGQINALMQEAKTIGATVALRGLINDDFQETFITLRQLAGELDAGLIIDPTLFKRFAVTTVPTFVLPLDSVQRCEKHNCPVPEFVKASGSATFQYFFDLVARVGSDREKMEAALWLENYEQ